MKNNIKKVYLTVSIVNAALGFIFKLCYRNYIYNNNIKDFGIADSAPNFFYTMGIIFLILYIKKEINKKVIKDTILFASAGVLAYEMEQYFTNRIFDFKDIIATILGGIVCYYIAEYLNKRYNLRCETECTVVA